MIITKHIIFGSSAAGNLKYYFKNQSSSQQVFVVNDDLSIGPLNNLTKRKDYLQQLSKRVEPGDLELKNFLVNSSSLQLNACEFENCEIVIWHSKNACEQTMLAFVVNQLQNLELSEVAIENKKDFERATAAYSPDKLGSFHKDREIIKSLRKIELANIWNDLAKSESSLRIWEDDKLKITGEDYFDQLILSNLSIEYKNASLVVGAALGSTQMLLSDLWVKHRLSALADQNKIKFKGSFRDFRDCKIALF